MLQRGCERNVELMLRLLEAYTTGFKTQFSENKLVPRRLEHANHPH